MSHNLSKKDQELIHDEEGRYQNHHARIVAEIRVKMVQLKGDQDLARQLTGEIVASQREEEKQALQSDESVAHGLARLRLKQSHALADLVEQPYFARVVYHENNRDVEFKLGLASFPELRIVDWRKAPISKLYYDYEEGQVYDDEIAGVDRSGRIILKRAYRGKDGTLTAIELKDASYVRSRGGWHRQDRDRKATFALKDRDRIKELLRAHEQNKLHQPEEESGYLHNILSLLTVEQFRLISTVEDKPVIIQGSAGTGKTTVALHRLAWLLFEGNSSAKEETSLVIMFNKSLAAYVQHVLPELGIRHVKITTFASWAIDIIETYSAHPLRLNPEPPPLAVTAYKSDHNLLQALQGYLAQGSKGHDPLKSLLDFYQSGEAQAVLQNKNDDTNNAGVVAAYLTTQGQRGFFDEDDLALLLHIIFWANGSYRSRKYPVFLDYLVIDEAQDFTLIELKAILNALEDKNKMTLAGDLGQRILEHRDFGTWGELLSELGLESGDVINLNLAFRCTYQIYELAECIRNPTLHDGELQLIPKFGPEPLLTICHGFSDAIEVTRNWLDDIIRTNRYTTAAIICRTSSQARLVYDGLLKAGTRGVRLGDAQHFDFTPGITITDVGQVKGLEFMNVLLFNPSDINYREDSLYDRNLLYVAVTRAISRVDFICYDTRSPLIPDFIGIKDLTTFNDMAADQPLFSDTDQDVSAFADDDETPSEEGEHED